MQDILDERKSNILKTIVKTYLDTGEPVGSRTISKLLNESLSSATIRNEMADLCDMGYIEQPHTSAGRIPSDKGYRFYVNELIKDKDMEMESFKAEMTGKVDKLENILKKLVEEISYNTNYPALISGPTINNNKIKYVQISSLEDNKVLIVVVAEGNIVKTIIVDVNKEIDSKNILNISLSLNKILTGKSFADIINENLDKEISKIKTNKDTIKIIIEKIITEISENETQNIYTYGANNFIKYKDYFEKDKVINLLDTFEQKNKLQALVDDINKDENHKGLNVYIGKETKNLDMQDCTLITADCNFGNGMKGTIGIVGPKRMDYEKVLKTLKNMMEVANTNLKKKKKKED